MASIVALFRIPDIPGSTPGSINYGPEKLMQPNPVKLTGKVSVMGLTDYDAVSATFRYRAKGATAWTDIKALFSRTLDTTAQITDPEWIKVWNNLGYNYTGLNTWSAMWDTTTLPDGLYEITLVANTGDNKSAPSNILTVEIDLMLMTSLMV